jgi:hypothetical protein
MRILILYIFLFSFLFSADLDFDGISDDKDYCPRTPLLAIVDKDGCEIKHKVSFNFNIELGEEYIISQKIPQQYFKTSIYHKSFETSFYSSRVKLPNSTFHTYSTLFDFEKRFYNQNDYYKIGLIYYPTTYYNKSSDIAYKFTYYSGNNDILMYYKFKKTGENSQKNKNTFFIEKFIKYPKIIVIPFLYTENSNYSNKFDQYIGISNIVKFKDIYTKFAISKSKNETVFSFSIGKNF